MKKKEHMNVNQYKKEMIVQIKIGECLIMLNQIKWCQSWMINYYKKKLKNKEEELFNPNLIIEDEMSWSHNLSFLIIHLIF